MLRLCWLVLLAVALPGWGRVVFEPDHWRPERPLLRATSASTRVLLRNLGDRAAELTTLESTGAAYARTAAKTIPPDGTVPVEVWVNGQQTMGPVTGQVTASFAGQAPAVLEVAAEVAPAYETGLLPAEVGHGHYLGPVNRPVEVRFFHLRGCEHCAAVVEEIVQPLVRYFGSAAKFTLLDISQPDGYVEGERLKKRYGLTTTALTYAFVGGRSLDNVQVDDALYRLVLAELAQPTPPPSGPDAPGRAGGQLAAQLERFGPLGALAIGLVDGVNPCAFATIVFLIALLSRLGHGRRTLLAAGLGYTLAVFVTYLLLGLGVLRALSWFGDRLALAKALRFAVAALSLWVGGLQLRDVLVLRRGGSTRELAGQLSTGAKQRAHALLRWSTSPRWGWLLVGLATTVAGVLVTLVEMACTSQVYLPVLILLRMEGWHRRAGLLLVAYNVGFVLPLLVVVGLALGGLSSAALAGWARRNLAGCKLALGLLLVALAAVLLVV